MQVQQRLSRELEEERDTFAYPKQDHGLQARCIQRLTAQLEDATFREDTGKAHLEHMAQVRNSFPPHLLWTRQRQG